MKYVASDYHFGISNVFYFFALRPMNICQHDIHIVSCSCRLIVKRWVPQVEHELLCFLDHMRSLPGFWCCSIFVCFVLSFSSFFASLFVLCTLLAIVLYDILRFKTLDYIYPLVSSNVRCMSFLLFWPLYGMTNVYWLLMRYVHI